MQSSGQTRNLEREISKIKSSWFLSEPLLFSVASKHVFVENKALSIPLRTGRLMVEYNPDLLGDATEEKLEAAFKCEILRALLGHPYARQPQNCKRKVLLLASDVILYRLLDAEVLDKLPYELNGIEYLKYHAQRIQNLDHPLGEKWDGTEELAFFKRNLVLDRASGRLLINDDLSFEQWYRRILFLIEQTSIAGSESAGNGGEVSLLNNAEEAGELWEENQLAQEELKNQLKKADADEGWGGIGGTAALELKESVDFSFDYKRALTRFRAKIVSAQRHLTRMRPSRRYGFSAMGSRYERKANILIAVDVSGSITEDSFAHFYKAISNFFFLGIIEKIDLIFFDVNLKNTSPIAFKGSRNKISLDQIKGRGGTSFQPPYDYFLEHRNEYSGMIIFTDGEGNPPLGADGTVLWILDSRLAYEKARSWIGALPGASATYLPF